MEQPAVIHTTAVIYVFRVTWMQFMVPQSKSDSNVAGHCEKI